MQALLVKLEKYTKDPALLLVIFFAFFTNGMMSTMLGAILPFMKTEYGMSYTLSGLVLSAHQAGNLAACFVAGFLPYLLGRKKSTISLGAGIFIGMLLMTVTGNPFVLVTAFALTGIGRGTMSNISNVVVSEITIDKAQSLNILHATFAVGALLAPFLTIFFTGTLSAGWRLSAWLVALSAFAMLVVFARSALSNEPAPREAAQKGEGFLSSLRFWICTGILFFYLCVEATVVGWLVTYFKDSGIMGASLAQSTSSLLWIMILIGRLLCAAFSQRMNKAGLVILMTISTGVFYLLMISTRDIRVIFPALMGLGISMAGIYPTTLACMGRFTSSTAAVGTCISTATAGAIIAPSIVGMIAERTSIGGGMAAITAALAVLVALGIFNYVTTPRA